MVSLSQLRRNVRVLGAAVCLGLAPTPLALQPLIPLWGAGAPNSNGFQAQAASASIPDWGAPLGKDEKILQLINRTTFGLAAGL